MSVIGNVNAVPNRIAIVYRFVQNHANGLPRADLREFLSPRALSGGDDTVDGVLREAKALGLLEELDDGVMAVPTELRSLSDMALLAHLESVLVNPDAQGEVGRGSFPYALAWFLTVDPSLSLPSSDAPGAQIMKECGEETEGYELTNGARFQNFAYWARYLGFAWRMELGGRPERVVPDPSGALERHLRAILKPGEEVRLTDVLGELAQRCPVLEGGAVRNEIEDRLPVERRRQDGVLSRSTSLALLRLRRRGTIELTRPADADAIRLGTWLVEEARSHIILRG